jgi:hypothetical protein
VRKYVNKQQRTRRAVLEDIFRDATATPADRLKALAAIERLEKAAAKSQPKPQPVEEAVPDAIIDLMADPPPVNPLGSLGGDLSPAAPTTVKPADPPAKWEPYLPDGVRPDTSVSWSTIWGPDAYTEDFKTSTELWARQDALEAEERQRIRRQEQDKAARRQGQAWLPGQREEMP